MLALLITTKTGIVDSMEMVKSCVKIYRHRLTLILLNKHHMNISRQKMGFRSTLTEVDPSILRKLDSRLDRQTCPSDQMVELASKHVGQDMGSMASMTEFSAVSGNMVSLPMPT